MLSSAKIGTVKILIQPRTAHESFHISEHWVFLGKKALGLLEVAIYISDSTNSIVFGISDIQYVQCKHTTAIIT